MNLKEIVFRSDKLPITQDESLYVIKEYIKLRKGVDVNPTINTSNEMVAMAHLQIMTRMVRYAIGWLRTNLD